MKSSYSIVGNGSAAGGGSSGGGSTVAATASFSSCASSSSSSSTSSAITLAASSSSSPSSSTTTQSSMKNATTTATATNGNHKSTIDGDSEQCYSGAILYGHSRKSQMVKCVFVGDGAIGKTSLIVSYTTNGYPAEYVPTAFDTYSVVVTIDNKPCQLQLCDTAGQDDFDSIRPLCYKYTDVFMVCFSVVSPASFQNVRQKWLPELRKSIQNGQCSKTGKSDSATSKTPPFILVGTQCDLRHDVKVLIELDSQGQQPIESDYARTMAKKFGAICYIECSALTQKNLKEVFDTAIISALDFQSQPKPTTKNHPNHNNHQAIYIRSPAGSSNGHRTDHHHRNKQPDGNSQHNNASHKDSTSHNPGSLATGSNRQITANQNHSKNKSKNRANISDARLVGWRKSLTKLSAQEALESESAQAMNRHNQNRNSTSNPTLPTSGDYCYSSSSSSSKTNSSTSCSESQSGLGLSVPVLAKSTYSPQTPRRHYPRNGQSASSASSSPIASTRALLHPTAFNPVTNKPLILSQNHLLNNNKKKAHISKSRHKHQPNQLTSDPEDDQGFHDVEEEFDDSCDKMDNYDDRIQLSTAKSNCHYYYHQQQPQQPVSRVPPATPNSPGKSSRTSKQSSPSYYYYQNRPLPSQPSPYAQHQYHYSPRPSQPVPAAATTTTTSNYSHQYQPVYQSSRPQPSKLQSFFQHLTRPLSSSSGSSGTSISHPSKLLSTKPPSNNPTTTITPTAHLQSTGLEPDHSRKPLFSNQTNLATTLRSSSFFFLSSNTFKKNKNISNNKKKETNNKDLKSSLELSSSACSGSSSSSSSIVSNSLFKNSKNGSNQSYRSEIFQIMSNSVTELRNRKSLLKKFTSSYSSSSTSSSSNNEKSRLKSKKLKDLYYYDYEDDDDYEEIDTNDRRSKCLFSCCLPF